LLIKTGVPDRYGKSDPVGFLCAHRDFGGAGVDQEPHARAVDLSGTDEVAARTRRQHDTRADGRSGRTGDADRHVPDAQARRRPWTSTTARSPSVEISVTPWRFSPDAKTCGAASSITSKRTLPHHARQRHVLRERRVVARSP